MCSKLNNTTVIRKSKISGHPTFNNDFTLFDHETELGSQPVTSKISSKTTTFRRQPKLPSQTSFISDASLTSRTATQLASADVHFMTSFTNSCASQHHELKINFAQPFSPYSPLTPFYPPDSMPTLSTPQINSYDINSVQSTPFLTPRVEFDQSTFGSNSIHPDNTPHTSLDFSLYCKGGSFHVDDDISCEDKHPALIAPLEEISSFNAKRQSTKCSLQSNGQEHQLISTTHSQFETVAHIASVKSSGSKDKRYGCDVCGLHFARKFNLNVHIRGHDPKLARPFDCPECPKSFGRKHDLSRHLATVHKGERPHQCPSCQKNFSRKDGLHRHLIKGCSST